jgi:hypothetical protein
MKERKKYEFIGRAKKFSNGVTVRRIRALRNIPYHHVKKGDIGGFLESEKNLSHFGSAWVDGDAIVCGDANVRGSSWVGGKARIWGNAEVYGCAWVFGGAKLGWNTKVSGNTRVGF